MNVPLNPIANFDALNIPENKKQAPAIAIHTISADKFTCKIIAFVRFPAKSTYPNLPSAIGVDVFTSQCATV